MAKGDASGKDESVTGGSESKEAPDRIDSDAAWDHAAPRPATAVGRWRRRPH